MKKTLRHADETSDALTRGALLRYVALGFSYPASGHVAAMKQCFRSVAPALCAGNIPPPVARLARRTHSAWRAMDDAGAAREYMRLFLGSGPVLLHETAWGDGRRIAGRTVELADVAGFYTAFGFAPSRIEPDIPDHLCAELEFAGLLRIKEAWALARGRRDQARIARDAARAFLTDHLGRWVDALAHSLTEYGAASPYREMGDLLAAVVAAECRDRGARPESATGRLPFDTMQEESFACPLAANDTQAVPM